MRVQSLGLQAGSVYARFVFTFSLALIFSFTLSSRLLATVSLSPIYQVQNADATWTQQGSTDVFTVPSAAYIHEEERWELPIEADKWTINGATIENFGDGSRGKYYQFIDMKHGRLGKDNTHLFISWETVGDQIYEPGSGYKSNGLNGLYYAYFGIKGMDDIVINLPGTAKDLPTTGNDFHDVSSNGWVKVYMDTNGDVPGTGIAVANEGGNGFDTEDSNISVFTRVSGSIVEVAVDLDSIGLTTTDINVLDYAMIGTAVSNPSSVSDLFANDHFGDDHEGAEYDNIRLGTTLGDVPLPEPSSAFLVLIGSLLLLRRQRG